MKPTYFFKARYAYDYSVPVQYIVLILLKVKYVLLIELYLANAKENKERCYCAWFILYIHAARTATRVETRV